MAIPKNLIEECLKKAEGCTYFGIKITDLTKDELIVALVCEETINLLKEKNRNGQEKTSSKDTKS